MQNNEDVEHKTVNNYCNKNQFPEFSFCGPHNKLHGFCRFSKNFQINFDPKLGHGTCAMYLITCVYIQCISTLYKP